MDMVQIHSKSYLSLWVKSKSKSFTLLYCWRCETFGLQNIQTALSRPRYYRYYCRYSVSSYRYRFMGQVSGQEEDSNKCVNASEIYQCCSPRRRISPGWLLLKSSTCAAVGTWRGVGEYVHCGTYCCRRTFANALTSWPGKRLFSIEFYFVLNVKALV